MNNRFGRLLQAFLTDYIIDECNYSHNTKASYSTAFYLLINYLKDVHHIKINDIKIEIIDKKLILNFLDWLENERDASEQTRNQRLAAIKSFYKFVQVNEPDLFNTCTQILSIKTKKVPKKMISYFSEKEIEIIIKYLSKEKKWKYFSLVCVLYETGARVSELINIKIEDINLSEDAGIKLIGKGNKIRIVPISQEVVKIINNYLNTVYEDYGEGYLFYSNYKRKYNRTSINYIVNTLVEKLKKQYPNYFKDNYSPHSFRHSKGTHLYNNGTPLLTIKELLGHETIISTEIYTTPDTKLQREQILKNALEIKTKNNYSKKKREALDNWLKNNMK